MQSSIDDCCPSSGLVSGRIYLYFDLDPMIKDRCKKVIHAKYQNNSVFKNNKIYIYECIDCNIYYLKLIYQFNMIYNCNCNVINLVMLSIKYGYNAL